MTVTNNAKIIRRDLLARLTSILLEEQERAEYDRIPLKMRPRDGSSIRCCVHRDRAVLKYKIMAMLGFDLNQEDDELKTISSYMDDYLNDKSVEAAILTVVDEACSSCQKNNYVVTNMCRGCVGRPCQVNCPKNAISFNGPRAEISADTCVSCGLCEKVCPFHAIIYSPVPCEEACPVDAIRKDERGKEKIDMDNCILCGKCMDACPFGAVVERSDLFRVIRDIRDGKELVAMVAPSIAGQFRDGMGKILGSLVKLGFMGVYEVASGADTTSRNEAKEFAERMHEGKSMTTSCCPAYVNMIRKHHADLEEQLSTTLSPMAYTAKQLKEEHPGAKLVFVGPCVGKKGEAQLYEEIDYVLNFEEIGSWLVGAGIEISECEEYGVRDGISSNARNYAWTGGVSAAVAAELPGVAVRAVQFDGIDRRFAKELRLVLNSKEPVLAEVMACEGGCLGGCSTMATVKAGRRLGGK